MLSQFFSIQYECFVFVHVPYCDVSWIFFIVKNFLMFFVENSLWKDGKRHVDGSYFSKKMYPFSPRQDWWWQFLFNSTFMECSKVCFTTLQCRVYSHCTWVHDLYILFETHSSNRYFFFFQQSYFSKSFASSGNFIGN